MWQVLRVDPMAVHNMRTLGLWDLAYGPAFFDFGIQVQLMNCTLRYMLR